MAVIKNMIANTMNCHSYIQQNIQQMAPISDIVILHSQVCILGDNNSIHSTVSSALPQNVDNMNYATNITEQLEVPDVHKSNNVRLTFFRNSAFMEETK